MSCLPIDAQVVYWSETLKKHLSTLRKPFERETLLQLVAEQLASRAKGGPGAEKGFSYLGEGLTYTTAPLAAPLEITRPAAAKLFVASSTRDADIFLTLRILDPFNFKIYRHGKSSVTRCVVTFQEKFTTLVSGEPS